MMNTADWVKRNPFKKEQWEAFAFKGKAPEIQEIELAVFAKGEGPGVIITHELPGMSQQCLRLAQEIVEKGFRVYLPLFFGAPGKTNTVGNSLRLFCLRREFEIFAKNKSGVITLWLNELSHKVRQECHQDGVGVIGMCLTGNFALAMMKYQDHGVKAPVLSQPSLPLYIPFSPGAMARKRALGLSALTVDAVLKWAKAEKEKDPSFYIPIFRFAEDFLSPAERVAAFKELGTCYFQPPEGTGLESVLTISQATRKAANIPRGATHSVLTGYFDTSGPNPTQKARDVLLEYLTHQLKD